MPKVSNILIIFAGVVILGLLLVYEPVSSPGRVINFEPVTRNGAVSPELGGYSGHTERRTYVLTDESDWQAVWEQHVSLEDPKASLPEIDFGREMVLAVFQGQFPTGGYSIEVKEVKEFDDKILIKIEELSPGENCITTQAFTAPFHIIKLKKLDKEVDLTIESAVIQCRDIE